MNKVYLLRQMNTVHYYSEILENKHCVYGFMNKTSALNCKDFLLSYKKTHSVYPAVDRARLLKFKGTLNPICIEYDYIEDMKNKCVLNGLHLVGIHTFEYKTLHEVQVKLVHLTDGLSAPSVFVRDNLEHLLTLNEFDF